MSEESFAPHLYETVVTLGFSGLKTASEKMVEESFDRTMAMAGESASSLILDQSQRLDAISFISERNVYTTWAQEASDLASRTSDLEKRRAAQLVAEGYRACAANLETRFVNQFAQGQGKFADVVESLFHGIGKTGGKLLGPLVGGAFSNTR